MTALHIRKNIRELLELSVTAAKKLEDVQVSSVKLGTAEGFNALRNQCTVIGNSMTQKTSSAMDSWRRKVAKAIEPNN